MPGALAVGDETSDLDQQFAGGAALRTTIKQTLIEDAPFRYAGWWSYINAATVFGTLTTLGEIFRVFFFSFLSHDDISLLIQHENLPDMNQT